MVCCISLLPVIRGLDINKINKSNINKNNKSNKTL